MSEVKLENLIERIKREGIEEAQDQAREIIEKARQEAAGIISGAKKEAEEIVASSRVTAEQFQRNGEISLQRSARDTVLTAREKLTKTFDEILKRDIQAAATPELVKEAILKIADRWQPAGASLEVLAAKSDFSKIEALLLAGLKKDAASGITIKVSDDVQSGFRIGVKGQDLYYDFTDESLLEALAKFVNPAVAPFIK